jgi:hypothetical protein
VKQIKRENTTFIKPRSMVGPRTSTVRLIEAPLVSLDQHPDIDAGVPSMAAATTSQLALVVNSHVAVQAVHDDDDDSCASFETHSEEIDFVRVINFDDFDPSLGAAYDMDLLDSVNVNWDEEANPTHGAREACITRVSGSGRIDIPRPHDLEFARTTSGPTLPSVKDPPTIV